MADQVPFKQCTGCSRETNNANFNCPIKGDYRLFTDWRPRCATQYYDMINNKLPSALDYRMFLTHNAETIIQDNALNAYMKARCGPCVDDPSWDDGTMMREFEEQKCDARTCTFRANDPWGLGRGRRYYDDNFDKEVRKEFITQKEKENEYFKRSAECCQTKEDELYYYPIDGGVQKNYPRNAVPSGASLLRGGDRLMTSQ